jgi:DNA-binding transcriptional MerR regulator
MAMDQSLTKTGSVEDNGLATRQSFSGELAPTAAAAQKQADVQSAIIVAKRFPRDEDAAFEKLMKACKRTSFAEDAEYVFPRGGQSVRGPSVNLAREAARVWGNIQYGLTITRDDPDSRQIQGWAWDVETNTRITAEDDFRKLIYRKKEGWIEPDERDLRELTNRRGAILIRNCILQLLPKDLIEDAVAKTHETLKTRAAQDPEGERKKIIDAFSGIGVSAEMLKAYLGHPIAQSSPAEIANLRPIFQSIRDGNSTWKQYVEPTAEEQAEDLKAKTQAKVAEMKEKLAGTAESESGAVEAEPIGESQETGEPSEAEGQLLDLRAALNDAGIDDAQIAARVKKLTGKEATADLTPEDLAKVNSSLSHLLEETRKKGGRK